MKKVLLIGGLILAVWMSISIAFFTLSALVSLFVFFLKMAVVGAGVYFGIQVSKKIFSKA